MRGKQLSQRNNIKSECQIPTQEMEEFFNIIPSMLAITTEDGYLTKINSAWTNILGFSQKELLLKPLFDFIHPDDIAQTLKEIEKQKSGFSTIYFINRYRCKDGSYRLLEWESTPASNGFLYTTARDITESKKIEKTLKENEFFFRESQRIALIGSYITDFKTGSWESSEVLDNILGIDATYVRNVKGWMDLIHPNDVEMMDRYLIEDILGKHNTCDKEYRIIRNSDGEIRWVKGRGELSFNTEGKVVSMIGTIQDITASIHMRESLLKSEKRYKSDEEIAHVGNWEYHVAKETFWASDEGKRIYGFDPELSHFSVDVVEKCIPERERVHQALIDLIEEGKEYKLEFEIYPENSVESRTIWSIADIERDKNGVPLIVYGVIQDITERKKTEKVMQRAQKLEALGVLAGGIAHDFNNLLGGIFGNIELAMIKTKEERVSTYLARSLSNIGRTRALTQQLLTFAKGGDPIKKVENLFPFIQESTPLTFSGTSISSQFKIEKNLWPCDFDKYQIAQVVNNLTINAKQAMPNGGTIEILACNISLSEKEHQSLAAGNYVKLSIKDHGIGISKEFLSRIFDPYYSTKLKGHGLGLSTCYSIVKRHGGYIDVESELGKGSTFHVYLPASTESVLTIPEDHTKRSSCKHTGSGTFLVMDDEEIIRMSMEAILEDFGYTVVLKDNGKDAIDFFMKETDANRKLVGMIFDLTIPGGMGGKDAIREIRKICSVTPAFVVSGYSEDPVIANPKEYGFNASLCKPFRMEELAEMLEKHLIKKT